MISIALSGTICGDPRTSGNQVVAIIAVMLMTFYSTSNIRTAIYLQMMLPFIHLVYFGIYETNCKVSWFESVMINDKGAINAHTVFVVWIIKPSHVHDHVDIMIYDIHIEQVLSMKHLGTYANDRLSRDLQCEKLYPQAAGKIAVLSRIISFYRSNEFKLLYENLMLICSFKWSVCDTWKWNNVMLKHFWSIIFVKLLYCQTLIQGTSQFPWLKKKRIIDWRHAYSLLSGHVLLW